MADVASSTASRSFLQWRVLSIPICWGERGRREGGGGVTMESTEYPYLLGGEGEERGGRGSYNGEY